MSDGNDAPWNNSNPSLENAVRALEEKGEQRITRSVCYRCNRRPFARAEYLAHMRIEHGVNLEEEA